MGDVAERNVCHDALARDAADAAPPAGEVTMMSTSRRVVIAGIVAAAVAAALLLVRRGDGPVAPTTPPGARDGAGTRATAADEPPSPPAGSATRRVPTAPSRSDAESAREALLRDVRAARARRLAGARDGAAPPAAASPAAADPVAPTDGDDAGDLDPEYVRQAVREILPLVRECYEAALERRPDLAGALVVTFTIEGEPEVGGVIGKSGVVEEGTTIDDGAFRECVVESMYALRIDPPARGGLVTVTYPFRFASGPE